MKTLFPEDFIWSTSSAAVQVEGAWNEGGKGESIWDTLVHEGGHVAHGENGDVACDQYHRFREDVAIMKELGLTAYRFSISWPRVLPEGTGRINEEGIQYYSDLCDELIKAGIKPMATLYHWDYPMELYKKGGWKNDRSSDWFEEYTEVISSALKDKVYLWMTFNEPQMFCGLGYRLGFHAPFEHVSDEELIGITKNVLLSHGKAVSVLRKNCPNSKIGMAPTGDCCCPKTSDPEALEEARKQSFSIKKDFIMSNAWWADPIFLGKYPEEAAELFGDKMYSFSEKEWAIVSQKLDFYGFNCYQGTVTMPAPADGYDEYGYQGSPKTVYNWNIMPESLYYSSKF